MSEIQPIRVTWDGAESLTKSLASNISASGFSPDYIVGLSRGGAIPAILFAHLGLWKPVLMIGVRREGEEE